MQVVAVEKLMGCARGGKSQWQHDMQELLIKLGGIERSNTLKNGLRSRVIEYEGRTFCFVSKAEEAKNEPS
jgi:hypothetical protein